MSRLQCFGNRVIAGETSGWQEMVVYLDGVYQPSCVEADIEQGYVRCVLRREDGSVERDDHGVVRFEMRYGRVEVRRKSMPLEQACARAIQVDRQIIVDLNHLLLDVQSGGTPDEVAQLLSVFIKRAANRTTVVHAEVWQALHPEWTGETPPLLPLSLYSCDAPSSAQERAVGTSDLEILNSAPCLTN